MAETGEPLGPIRHRPENTNLFRGLGPIIVGAILFVLMVLLLPTQAPERVVERPVETSTVSPSP